MIDRNGAGNRVSNSWEPSVCKGRFGQVLCLVIVLISNLISFTSAEAAARPDQRGIPQKYLSRFSIRTWSIAEGLPQGTVRSIIQTRDGFLWFGTEEGLVRFDGVQFTVFDTRNTPGIPHNNITSLLELADGSLLVGTFGGLVQLKDGCCTSISQILSKTRIQSLFKDKNGVIWIGSEADGMFSFVGGRTQQYTVNEGLCSNSVTSIAEDLRGNLWIGTNAGLMRMRDHQLTSLKSEQGMPSEEITSLCASLDSSLWIGTSEGLVQLHDQQLRIYQKTNGLSDNSIQCILQDRIGDLWIGTELGGVNRMSLGNLSSLGVKDGLSSNYVYSLMEDREGNVWVGTASDGVNRLWEGNFAHVTVRNGFARDNPVALFETSDGAVWIGTVSGGATRISENSVTTFTVANGLPADMVRSFAEDTKGGVWLGTRSGLVRFANGRLRTFTTKNGLSNENIRALVALPDGSVLIGSTMGTVDEYRDGRISQFKGLSLTNTVVRAMFRDRSGAVWIGHNGGMIRWSEKGITTFNPDEGSPTEPVYTFHEDDEGTLWIGTYAGGLYRYKNDKFSRITTKAGLFDDVVFQILEDDQHSFWMSCNKGIFRVDKKELNDFADGKISAVACMSYGISDGMITSECNGNAQPAGCKTRDGRLLFPTTKGVVVINPRGFRTNPVPPPVVIEKAIIDKTPYVPTMQASAPAGKGELEFQYAGLSYTAPEKVRFKYKLVGYDDDWKECGTRRTALYTNIPPGTYTFRVAGCNNDDVWNLDGASFEFVIAPHYYQARWFYLLAIAVFTMLIIAVYRARVLQLLKREVILKERVEEALAKIKILGGLIPICANCKKIRDDAGYWELLESYISKHSEAKLSHSLCPDCAQELYPNIFPKKSKT